MSRNGAYFRRLLERQRGDAVYELSIFWNRFDISTVYPLLLYLLDEKLPNSEWHEATLVLESYLLRRAILGWTTKAYNRVFLVLIKTLRECGATAKNMKSALSLLTGESAAWPSDAEFAEAWLTRSAYETLNNAKIVHILKSLSDVHLSTKTETVSSESSLTVEHILPQNWLEHWPLQDGQKGLAQEELFDAPPDDPRAVATRRRETVLHTFGNLTILTQGLNAAVSNSMWSVKNPDLMNYSLLPINQQLHEYSEWDDNAIQKRGRLLFDAALKIWPAPQG